MSALGKLPKTIIADGGYGGDEKYAYMESGYEIKKRQYQSESCDGCLLKETCTKAKRNREISVSMKCLHYKQEVQAKLGSEEGYTLSVRRMTEPESVFGQMKTTRDSDVFCFEACRK